MHSKLQLSIINSINYCQKFPLQFVNKRNSLALTKMDKFSIFLEQKGKKGFIIVTITDLCRSIKCWIKFLHIFLGMKGKRKTNGNSCYATACMLFAFCLLDTFSIKIIIVQLAKKHRQYGGRKNHSTLLGSQTRHETQKAQLRK